MSLVILEAAIRNSYCGPLSTHSLKYICSEHFIHMYTDISYYDTRVRLVHPTLYQKHTYETQEMGRSRCHDYDCDSDSILFVVFRFLP